MKNLSFVCLGHNQKTTFEVIVLNEDNRIVDTKDDLHDLHAADEFTRKKYEHALTIGECYANYADWRLHKKNIAQ